MSENYTSPASGAANNASIEAASDAMAYGIFENAQAYLTGDRPSFSAWLVTTEASHARAAQKLAYLLEQTPFANEARKLHAAHEETWDETDHNIQYRVVSTRETVALNGVRKIIARSTYHCPTTDDHVVAELAQVVYSSEEDPTSAVQA